MASAVLWLARENRPRKPHQPAAREGGELAGD